MTQEEILLLVKEKQYEAAIKIYIQRLQDFNAAEEFCKEHC